MSTEQDFVGPLARDEQYHEHHRLCQCLECRPRPLGEAEMAPGQERRLRASGIAIGFVRRTLGGHYRAYSSRAGCGYGPFETEASAGHGFESGIG